MKAIVEKRNSNGPFSCRRELLKIKGLGARRYEQAAGFLRLALFDAEDEPLDATGIHPEAYDLTYKMLKSAGINDKHALRKLLKDPASHIDKLGRIDPTKICQ